MAFSIYKYDVFFLWFHFIYFCSLPSFFFFPHRVSVLRLLAYTPISVYYYLHRKFISNQRHNTHIHISSISISIEQNVFGRKSLVLFVASRSLSMLAVFLFFYVKFVCCVFCHFGFVCIFAEPEAHVHVACINHRTTEIIWN